MRDGSRMKQVMYMELAMQREMAYRKKLQVSQMKQGNQIIEDPHVHISGMSGRQPRSTTTPTSSTWLNQSQKPPNPTPVPLLGGSGPRPLQTRAPCSPIKTNDRSRFVAKSGSQSFIEKPEPILQQSPKSVVVLPKPIPGPFSGPIQRAGPIEKRKEALNQQFGPGKGSKVSKLYCGLCKVSCSSLGNLEDHLKGQKHQSKKRMGEFGSRMGIMNVNDRRVVFCEMCGVWCMNEFSYHQHLSGKSHILKLHTAKE